MLRGTELQRCDTLANHKLKNCTSISNPMSEFVPTKVGRENKCNAV